MDEAKIAKDALLRDLATKNYSAVPFPLSHEDIERAVGAFFDYLTLPEETKTAMLGKRPTDVVSDVGYVCTKGEADQEYGRKDFKEYFHYHPDAEVMFAQYAKDPKVRALFDEAAVIYQEAGAAVEEVIRSLTDEFPDIHEMFFPKDKPMERILRFLKYDNRGEGQFLARGHYDRGGCTLALAESAPGLRIGKDEASLTPIVHQDKTAIFMPSFHFSALTDGKILPAWHDVVQASGDTVSSSAARWAVVYFVNAPGLEMPSSKETHVPVK